MMTGISDLDTRTALAERRALRLQVRQAVQACARLDPIAEEAMVNRFARCSRSRRLLDIHA